MLECTRTHNFLSRSVDGPNEISKEPLSFAGQYPALLVFVDLMGSATCEIKNQVAVIQYSRDSINTSSMLKAWRSLEWSHNTSRTLESHSNRGGHYKPGSTSLSKIWSHAAKIWLSKNMNKWSYPQRRNGRQTGFEQCRQKQEYTRGQTMPLHMILPILWMLVSCFYPSSPVSFGM